MRYCPIPYTAVYSPNVCPWTMLAVKLFSVTRRDYLLFIMQYEIRVYNVVRSALFLQRILCKCIVQI